MEGFESESMNKKKKIIDLLVIMLISGVALTGYTICSQVLFPGFEKNESINIILRVLLVGFLAQFGLAGMGISIVCLYRKDSFFNHGLQKKNLLISIGLSLLCCVPDLIYSLSTQTIYGWFPFIGVNFTGKLFGEPVITAVISYLLIALFWGFFEGFNYVVMADKLNELLPSKYKYLDWGALIMAIFCVVIHGCVGVTPSGLIEMFTTMFLIYGMLVVRKVTGNAWGCVAVFFVYWNAINKYYPVLFK